MKKLEKGSVLTTTILVIFVTIMIGSAVLNLVVYNYRLRTLDLNIKKVESKNEVVMDKLYEITQGTILSAIGMAKKYAISTIDKAVEEEISNYQRLEKEKRRLALEWENGLEDDVDFDGMYQELMDAYIEENLADEYKEMKFELTDGGVQNQYKIQNAYNKLFQELYKYCIDRDYDINVDESTTKNLSLDEIIDKYLSFDEIESLGSLESNITDANNYTDIVQKENLFFSNELGFRAQVAQPTLVECVNIKNELQFGSVDQRFVLSNEIWYKVKDIPTATLSADFIISVPQFNDVASLEQKVIEFNNPLLDGTTLIAGKKISFKDSNVNVYGNALALGGISLDSAQVNDQGSLITPDDITLKNSTLSTNTVYYQNLYLNGTEESSVTFNGDVYAKDDLEIATSKFKISQPTGNYYGFNDVNGSGPDESSSIIINTTEIDGASWIRLNNLYLAGRAFIDKVLNPENVGETYKTGESISVKGNYIAYQNPILNSDSNYYVNKLNYGSYLYNNKVQMKLVDSFAGHTLNSELADFDVNHKWQYFLEFAKNSISLLKLPNITINKVMYMQGAGVGRIGDSGDLGVIGAHLFGNNGDQAFRTNCANEYEVQTKYFGCAYNEKEYLFGTNGWLNTITSENVTSTQPIYISNSSKTFTSSEISAYKVVICQGDVTINVTNNDEFHGVIIARDNIYIKGNGSMSFYTSKNDVVSLVLTGIQDATSTATKKLSQLFKDDGSGKRYVITEVGDGYIDMDHILGITNWNKKDWGYL